MLTRVFCCPEQLRGAENDAMNSGRAQSELFEPAAPELPEVLEQVIDVFHTDGKADEVVSNPELRPLLRDVRVFDLWQWATRVGTLADLTEMQVLASIDESEVGRMRPGQPVTFRVDAYANDTFRGEVKEVRLQPTTVQNVVTYNVVVTVPNPEKKLFPGMTANVSMEVERRDGVLQHVVVDADTAGLDDHGRTRRQRTSGRAPIRSRK